MRYIPSSSESEREMLNTIGIERYEALLDVIPDNLKYNKNYGLPKNTSEYDLIMEAQNHLKKGKPTENAICFSGCGAYDHFVPEVVNFLSSRSEFYTSYTPYQAEVSQGTLQYLYEFQTMICEITGMDVANGSLYDGGSAIAEACSLAVNYSRNKTIYISEGVNPRFIEVVRTYLSRRQINIKTLPLKNGKTDLSNINLEDNAGVVFQYPNYFGVVEDVQAFSEKLQDSKTQLIVTGDPIAYGMLKSPGECGADIYAGEGQVFGNPLNYGGPYLGLFSAKKHLMRKMPGRIIGKTEDIDGNDGYVLTLQTREQHIRRENATSNICTNQGLLALRATIYLSLLGKNGFKDLAKRCFSLAHFLAGEIGKIPGYTLPFGKNFFREFLVKTPVPAKNIIKAAKQENLILASSESGSDNEIIIAVTEKRSVQEMKKLITVLKKNSI